MKTKFLTLHTSQDIAQFGELTASEVLLPAQVILRLDGDQRGVRIHSRGGNLWVTQSGDVQDHLVRPGEPFTVDRAGMVLIQGLPSARLCIRSEEDGRRSKLLPWLITRIKAAGNTLEIATGGPRKSAHGKT